MHIVVHSRLAEIDAVQWNAMVEGNNPFMRHEFLSGLELCGCVNAKTGWQPSHIAVYGDEKCKTLLGVMPCYVKEHSYGEYIFDWAWADAHQRHGIAYYPKLSNAVPFTPATGQRWLLSDKVDNKATLQTLVSKALEVCDELSLSSMHSLFLPQDQSKELIKYGFSQRHSTQFHWQNKDYDSFADFTAGMSSKKRKNINRERRRIKESGIEYRWLTGDDLNIERAQQMYAFYARTIARYGAQSYLNQAFFEYITDSFNSQALFLFAYHQDQVIAGGLYFKSDNTLYGRYWGALENFHSVHFETCYYQAIEWCIKNGYQYFEAGAQGEHKLARGLEPITTYSAHWIRHPQFRDAIGNYLEQEQEQVQNYRESLQSHSPFKTKQ